jgi:DNA-3-methyladenine glycosylase
MATRGVLIPSAFIPRPNDPPRSLRRSALPVDTTALARFLIGKILVRDHSDGRTTGRIVETEAYVVGDAAAHTFRGETPRNRSMFLERGHAYVYFIYGCWHALNVSGEIPGVGGGVLLRALEPLQGIDLLRRRRGTDRILDLARGPGRLAMAMAVDRSLDGVDLCRPGPLWLATDGKRPPPIEESVRIGISREIDRKLRFFARDNAFVSGPVHLRR